MGVRATTRVALRESTSAGRTPSNAPAPGAHAEMQSALAPSLARARPSARDAALPPPCVLLLLRMAACLRPCRAPPVGLQASIYEDDVAAPSTITEEDRAVTRTKKLRSAVQRSAAPGKIADYYEFRRTLGASWERVLGFLAVGVG